MQPLGGEDGGHGLLRAASRDAVSGAGGAAGGDGAVEATAVADAAGAPRLVARAVSRPEPRAAATLILS
ncbi:MAG: hypothetical protein ACRD0H_22905, partial [Actinomycetes bacterium]